MSNFAATMIKGMGYQGATINLLSSGPLAFSVIVMLAIATLADRMRIRGPLLLLCLSVVTLGQTLILCDISLLCTYVSMYLVAGFSAPCNTLVMAWCASNVGPQYTKMSTMALVMLSHTAASLVSANTFPPSDAPRFFHAHLIGLIGMVVATLATALLILLLKRENSARERHFPLDQIDNRVLATAMQVNIHVIDGKATGNHQPYASGQQQGTQALSDDDARAFWLLDKLSNEEFARLGDRHPGFRYVI